MPSGNVRYPLASARKVILKLSAGAPALVRVIGIGSVYEPSDPEVATKLIAAPFASSATMRALLTPALVSRSNTRPTTTTAATHVGSPPCTRSQACLSSQPVFATGSHGSSPHAVTSSGSTAVSRIHIG